MYTLEEYMDINKANGFACNLLLTSFLYCYSNKGLYNRMAIILNKLKRGQSYMNQYCFYYPTIIF